MYYFCSGKLSGSSTLSPINRQARNDLTHFKKMYGEASIQLPLPVAHNKLPYPLSQVDSWLIENEIVNPVTVNPVTVNPVTLFGS